MMDGWEEIKLGDVLDKIIGGGTPSKNNQSYWHGNIPWCSVKDMSDEKFIVSNTEDSITDVGLNNSSANLISKGTVVTATRMGLGRAFITGCDMAINQDLKALIPNSKIDNKFLLWLIIVNRENLDNLGTGSTVKGIRLETLRGIKINLPPPPTQRKIASILSAYDDLIENNLKRIKLLEEKAQLTYEEWFVRMKFPGHETTPFNKETGLPEGWVKRKIKEIANFQNGYAFYTKGYSDNGFAVIDLANVSEWGDLNITGKEKFISEELYESLPKFHLQKYDIIIAMTDVTSALRILAKSAIIDKDNTYALNQRVGMLRPNTDLFDYSFLYALLSDIRFIERMKAMSKGAVQFYFNTKDIVNYETFIPSKEVIDDFVKHYKPLLELRMKLKDQNKNLKEARDILLPRLMTGMIDVEQLNLETLQPTNA